MERSQLSFRDIEVLDLGIRTLCLVYYCNGNICGSADALMIERRSLFCSDHRDLPISAHLKLRRLDPYVVRGDYRRAVVRGSSLNSVRLGDPHSAMDRSGHSCKHRQVSYVRNRLKNATWMFAFSLSSSVDHRHARGEAFELMQPRTRTG
ncbi:hypothetical protein BR93DRAFT_529794 [Coniochaeta sp. PMI_546]|nr:hypothetical protein BR93DRAFT_529794 [Coniochaeta sp. PMI_546]